MNAQTEPKNCPIAFARELRRFADLLESGDLPLGEDGIDWAQVSQKHVQLGSAAFRAIFAGREVEGKQDGCVFNAVADAYGFRFRSMLFNQIDHTAPTSMQL